MELIPPHFMSQDAEHEERNKGQDQTPLETMMLGIFADTCAAGDVPHHMNLH
jgi:hypothetical protein